MGILGLAGLVAVFFILRKFVPALAKLFLILGGVAVLGVVALVIAVIYFAFRKPKKTVEQQKSEAAASTLQKGRTQLMDIRRLAMKIKHQEIRKVSESICSIIDRKMQPSISIFASLFEAMMLLYNSSCRFIFNSFYRFFCI